MRSQTNMTETGELLVGVDWADGKHDFHYQDLSGQLKYGSFKQSPEAIDAWVSTLAEVFPDTQILVCIEQSQGALVAGLLKYPQVTIYPINPAQLSNYRKSQKQSGAKNDPTDAQLLYRYLANYRELMRCLQPEDSGTRELALLSEQRRGAVDQRTAVSLELKASLKQYFPLVVRLLDSSDLYANFILQLILKWPTLAQLQKVARHKVRSFFYAHNVRGDVIERRLELITNAMPLTEDVALLNAGVLRAQKCARLLLALNQSIREYDDRIEELLHAHADYAIVESLPGSAVHMQSRIIAALGTDRKRFNTAKEIQCYSGIAPVTVKSGKKKTVHHRWACPKFLKQTFYEYAGISVRKSRWAKAFYEMKLQEGHSTHVAQRALAFKWIRIIFRCWQDRKPYNENDYLAALRRTNSPLLAYLDDQPEFVKPCVENLSTT
jgi:transposase